MENPIYIAYAEDHGLVRHGMAELLNADGRFHVTIEAENGRELLERIAAAKQKPDLCLIDISMPEMNGYEAVLEIRKQFPTMRCLAITMADNELAIIQMLANGAMGYVTKNSNINQVKTAICEVHEGDFYFCPDVLKIFPKISRNNLYEYAEKMLSELEMKILSLLCSDMTDKQIAERMNLSYRTIETHIGQLRTKLKIRSRVGLALYALYAGIGNFNTKEKQVK